MIAIVFNRHEYMWRQMIDALTCPVNRHFTRQEHACDDWHLHKNPHLLMEHYVANGGAAAFAKRRSEFTKEVEIPDVPELEFFI